jgi:hypothetical protein
MNARHWWDLIIAGILTVMAAIAVQGYSGTSGRVGALVTLAAVGVAYLCGGRRALAASLVSPEADATVMPATAGNIVFRVTLILACGVATAFDSNMATLQILAFPALWILAGSFRSAVLLNVALAGSTGIGLWLGLGGTADAAVQAVIIEGISLAFSLAMGIWISSIADAGTRQRRLLQELTAAQDELAAAHRDAGSASERERLAREIHDTIAQSLTSLVMIAQRTRSQLAELPGDTSAVADSVDLIESTGRDALTEARALVASMAPVQVGDADLAHTVARLAERFDRETGIRVAVDVVSTGRWTAPWRWCCCAVRRRASRTCASTRMRIRPASRFGARPSRSSSPSPTTAAVWATTTPTSRTASAWRACATGWRWSGAGST